MHYVLSKIYMYYITWAGSVSVDASCRLQTFRDIVNFYNIDCSGPVTVLYIG
jgi:hypothetical protein